MPTAGLPIGGMEDVEKDSGGGWVLKGFVNTRGLVKLEFRFKIMPSPSPCSSVAACCCARAASICLIVVVVEVVVVIVVVVVVVLTEVTGRLCCSRNVSSFSEGEKSVCLQSSQVDTKI